MPYNENNSVFTEEQKKEIKEICSKSNSRQFTTDDIKQFRKELNTVIIAPYHEEQVKGVGYNLTASNMIYSLTRHKLLKIKDNQNGKFFTLSAHDTALILTNEYFKLSDNVAGNFYSRVRRVSEGLGHISTTLDPNWKGMFLISLTNSTNKKIKVQLSSKSEGKETKIGIATVVLTGINGSNIEDEINLDNPAMRIDILRELADEERIILKKPEHNAFKKLVNNLENFSPNNTKVYELIKKIKNNLEKIETALFYEEDAAKAKVYINKLNWFDFENYDELKRKIQELQKYLAYRNYDLIKEDGEKINIKKEIEVLRKECDYILLCENVNQIHALIDTHIKKYNKYSAINSKLDWLWENRLSIFIFITMLVITIVLSLILFAQEPFEGAIDNTTKGLIIATTLTALITGLTAKLFKL